jgi:membrane protein YqaA with SNARE-associated domain
MRHFRDVLISYGPWGLLVLATVESLGIPNPGGTDIALILLTVARPQDAWWCAAMAVIGSLAGSAVFFEVIHRGGERYLAQRTSSGRGAKVRAWVQRYGLVTVFIPALLPIPLLPFKAFAACAAALGCSRRRFLLVLLAGRVPRYFGLAYLGAHLGEDSWPWVQGHVWYMLGLAVLIFVALYVLIRWADREQLQ